MRPTLARRAALAAALLGLLALAPAIAGEAPVRVAVVGGLVLSGVWPALAEQAAAATDLSIETVAAAPKEGVVPAFRNGEADLLLMHGSDETYALQAAGYAAPLRAWAKNEHVFAGPADDPADIAHARDGTDALHRILAADAPMIGFRDPGSFTIVAGLLRAAGLRLGAKQMRFADRESPQDILKAAAAQHAYVVVGHIPVAFGKMPAAGLHVLFRGDPRMRRVYVAVEPGPRHPADPARRASAHRLAEYLLSPAGQQALAGLEAQRDGPWVFGLEE